MHFTGAHRDSKSGEFGVCFLLESFFTSEEPSGLSLSQLGDASAPGSSFISEAEGTEVVTIELNQKAASVNPYKKEK